MQDYLEKDAEKKIRAWINLCYIIFGKKYIAIINGHAVSLMCGRNVALNCIFIV